LGRPVRTQSWSELLSACLLISLGEEGAEARKWNGRVKGILCSYVVYMLSTLHMQVSHIYVIVKISCEC
jgi:hypothetical protein